jgi:hypothetical protein
MCIGVKEDHKKMVGSYRGIIRQKSLALVMETKSFCNRLSSAGGPAEVAGMHKIIVDSRRTRIEIIIMWYKTNGRLSGEGVCIENSQRRYISIL